MRRNAPLSAEGTRVAPCSAPAQHTGMWQHDSLSAEGTRVAPCSAPAQHSGMWRNDPLNERWQQRVATRTWLAQLNGRWQQRVATRIGLAQRHGRGQQRVVVLGDGTGEELKVFEATLFGYVSVLSHLALAPPLAAERDQSGTSNWACSALWQVPAAQWHELYSAAISSRKKAQEWQLAFGMLRTIAVPRLLGEQLTSREK
jgi:hypothetical protein